MVDNFEVLRALRAHLKAVPVATATGGLYGKTATAFTRTTGSFITEGFVPGMEVAATGFISNSGVHIITGVTETQLTVATSGMVPEAPTVGRTLVVGLPALRAWENMPFVPIDNRWYIDEDYLPGQSAMATFGELDHGPIYVIKLYGLAGKGVEGLYRFTDAILRHFRPNLPLPLADGYTAVVRTDPPPFRGQVLPEGASHALVVVTVPLWVRTAITD